MSDTQEFITREKANGLVRAALASKQLCLLPNVEYSGDSLSIRKWPEFSKIPLDDRYLKKLYLGYGRGEHTICYDAQIDHIKLSFDDNSPDTLCAGTDKIEIYQWVVQLPTDSGSLDQSPSILKRFTSSMDLDIKRKTIEVYNATKAKDMRFRKIEDRVYNALAVFANYVEKLFAMPR